MDKHLQNRLMLLAALFLCLYATGLTFSPAVLARTWNTTLRWSHWLGLAGWGLAFILVTQQVRRRLPDSDPYILPVIALLSGWGLLTIWRLSPGFGLRQTAWLVFSGLVFSVGLRFPDVLTSLRRYKYVLLTSGLLLTALTLFFGTNPTGGGPRLWLGCCGLYFQPSEPLKLLLVIYLAAYLADRPSAYLRTLPLLLPIFLMTGAALLLLLVQRDLGTASIFIALHAMVVFLATGRKRVLLISVLGLGLAGLVGYYFVDIIHLRLDSWLNPWQDPAGSGYQIIQSLLAVANGGLLGRGPGLGQPSLVPIAISDFIFPAIAEEAGLLGSSLLLAAFALLVVRGFTAAQNAPDRFRRLLAGGLSAYLAAQAILITGGNLRLLPLTGVTFPFLSYGGSALLTSFLAALLLLIISGPKEQEEPAALLHPQPYALLCGLLVAGLAAAVLADGWWAVVRAPSLLTRTDNPRRTIADRYVPRGDLLDRNNREITVTQGDSGGYTRIYLYPDLAPVTGYTQATYGQAGLEASLDPYLRGMQGNPASLVWWHHLLYGQPPAGLDVRLSLDLDLQRRADALLGERSGAVVLVNAQNGEILVMASHPTYDPNLLESSGQELLADKRGPLVNRAAQGRYPPGTALGPFLLAGTYTNLPDLPKESLRMHNGVKLGCIHPPATDPDWPYALANGCPVALEALGRQIGSGGLLSLYDALGFYSAPQASLLTAPAAARQIGPDPGTAALGLDDLEVSPLQMALAAATLSAGGQRPAPRLAVAVKPPGQEWVILAPGSEPAAVVSAEAAQASAQMLMAKGQPFWQAQGQSRTGDQPLSWYIAGTPPDWQGAPLAIAVLLEEDNPALASHIGQAVLLSALNR